MSGHQQICTPGNASPVTHLTSDRLCKARLGSSNRKQLKAAGYKDKRVLTSEDLSKALADVSEFLTHSNVDILFANTRGSRDAFPSLFFPCMTFTALHAYIALWDFWPLAFSGAVRFAWILFQDLINLPFDCVLLACSLESLISDRPT